MSNSQLENHITEETLHAWLDNELSRRESGTVQEHVNACADCDALLVECRELRGTVSQLLSSFDADLAAVPREARSSRAKLVLSSRIPSAPIISHIVADSQPALFWPSARKFSSMAALALIFAGTASLLMVRGYHAVAGSVDAVASARSENAVYSSKNTVTVIGTVTTVGGQPVKFPIIRVHSENTQKPSIQVVGDRGGRFKIRGVPRTATALEVISAIGYSGRTHYVDFTNARNPTVNIVLAPQVLTLEPFVVSTAKPIWDTPPQTCLRAYEPFTSADPRMFQELRGAFKSTGDFRMDVVDWPTAGSNVSAVFTLESTNTLVGHVWSKSADLRITLTRDGQMWRGSASETLNGKARWRRIAMRESSCAIR